MVKITPLPSVDKQIKAEAVRQELANGNKASQSQHLTLKSRLKLIRMESAGIQPVLNIR